ncbi:MAG: aminotransferase class III-fold pyridoxal phosphate-dependent enzyme [Kordiimonadaceae bacterium]|nr:aminotransferase class III-fold pyridoxal phosphate-dependent enzyme [Kordiimonadaceae bacterium]
MSTQASYAPNSALLFERAKQVMPSGYTRHMAVTNPHPVYAEKADGCWITDVEGNKRIDYVNNFSALIHGHNKKEITDIVTSQVSCLISAILPSEWEIKLAELITARIPSCEQVRFMNSGTEAVMIAVKAGRAYSGKSKIAKMEGGYHGQFDLTETSFQPNPGNWGSENAPNSVAYTQGTPKSVTDEVVILPLNNIEAARAILRANADDIGTVIIDPLRLQLGMVEPDLDYLEMLREETEALGMVLVFDEVFSLRSSYGGTQGLRGVTPDLTAMGKIIGGGMPIGGLGGKKEFMSVFALDDGDPKVKHSGTFTANPMSMATGYVGMSLMTPEAFAELDRLGEKLREGLRKIAGDLGVVGHVEGVGSLNALIMHEAPIKNYREFVGAVQAGFLDRIQVFHQLLLEQRLLTMRGGFILSTAMTDDDIDFTLEGVSKALTQMQAL